MNYLRNNVRPSKFKNTTTNNIDYSASASFESNTRVNKSMMVESLTKIMNNAVNDVKQQNTAQAAALASAINTIAIMGGSAKNIIIKNITQNADANIDATIDTAQSNVSSIINTMVNSIEKQIIKEDNISDIINEIENANQENLQIAIDSIPPVPNIPTIPSKEHMKKLSGFGNKTTNNIDVDYENNIKKMLEIEDSFKVSDNNNLTNELVNTVVNTNYTNCQADIIAQNTIAVINQKVEENIIIDNVTQIGKANINLNCAFNQTNISNISNKIVNQISTTINNLYKGIQTNPTPEKYEFLHFLGAAVADKIVNAGNNTQPNSTQPNTQPNTQQNNNQPNNNQQNNNQPNNNQQNNNQQNNNQQNNNQQNNNQQNNNQQNNNMIIYGIIGIIVFLFFIMIMIMINKK
jgi:hypothetical protein